MTRHRVRWRGLATVMAAGFLLAVASPAAAQSTGTVSGRVSDATTDVPLAGAQVVIVGTQLGAIVAENGSFVIPNVPAGTYVVRAQMLGYAVGEVEVSVSAGGTAQAMLALRPSAIGLDEIVVTGTTGRGQARRTLGNSISQVKAAEIAEVAPVTDVRQLLQGRSPGVMLVNSTGVVGGGGRMRIRGSSSLNAGNEPVVYVDGIRVQSGQVQTEGNTAQPINLLEAFNPNDIESIEIIKGPAAATLYGAEAATGVIQIITKKGRPAEGLQWRLTQEYGQVDWAPEHQITTYWLCTDDRMADLANNPGCGVFDPSQPLEERLLVDRPLDPKRRSAGVKYQYQENAKNAAGTGVDWTKNYPCLYPQQAPCKPNPLRTGVTRATNISVRGGGQAYNFYLSGEKSDQDGTFYNNYNNRIGGRANFGFTPSENANFNVNVGYVSLDQQLPQSDNSSNSVLRNAYRGQAGGPAGQYLPGFRNYHPEFSNKYNRHLTQERLTLGISASYNPLSWWSNRLTIGMDSRESQNIIGNPIDQTGGVLYSGNAALGSQSIGTTKVWLWSLDYSGDFRYNINPDLSSKFSVGMQMVRRKLESYTVSGNGFVANQLNLISAAANRNAGQGFSEQTSLGFYLDEQVGWRNRLFVNGAIRIDDNSAFGREFELVAYPKASVSWVVSEEEFFDVSWLDELKVRGAWGRAGNAPAPFSADRTYGTDRAVIGDVVVNTLEPSEYGNPNLKAETGDEFEFGFDGSLFGGRIGLDFTFYNKTTRDALLSVNDPPSSGWTGTHLINVGEINNKGIELGVSGAVVQRRNVRWDMYASFSTNSNKLVSFGRDAEGNPILIEDRFGEFLSVQRHREGYPLGGYWATDVQRDADGRPILGDDGVALLKECPSWAEDQRRTCEEEFVGPAFPTRLLGLTNTITLFGNLRLYGFLDYQGGHYQWCAICSVRTRTDRNSKEINDPRLDPSHPDYETWGRYELGLLLSAQTKRYIYPADFIKLREVSATYTIPQRFTQRYGMDRVALTLSGRNLWIWTKYKGNADPEVAFTGTASFTTSDYGSIPMQRRWILSMDFSF